MPRESTSKRVASDAAWLLKNWPRIQRAMAAVIGSALTQREPRRKAAVGSTEWAAKMVARKPKRRD